MMNRFAFAWEPAELAHPTGDPRDGWTMEKADIGPKTTVVIFSPGGKTAVSLAHQLKHNRPAGKLPHAVIGIGSAGSQAFTQGTGLYDKVLTYEADSGDLTTELELHPESSLVICDFGGRDNAAERWTAKLHPSHSKIVKVYCSGPVKTASPEKISEEFGEMVKEGRILLNASGLRSQGMEILGEKKYFEEFLKAWEDFKAQGGIKGLDLVWGSGMDDWKKGWEDLATGRVGPDQGLVYKL